MPPPPYPWPCLWWSPTTPASAAALCDALASTAEFAAKTRREIRAETLREAADAANEPTGAAAAYEARRRLVDRLRAIADAAERGQ